MAKTKSNRQKMYEANKAAKVREEIVCPICGTHFIKKTYQQAFCSSECKNKYWNAKGDRHKNPNYYHNYNVKHPERLERIGIYEYEKGKFGYYDDEGEFQTFANDFECYAMCEDPIMGI